jgi:hypothetical protein
MQLTLFLLLFSMNCFANSVYLVNEGMHIGLVVKPSEFSELPQKIKDLDANYIEISVGESTYFRTSKHGLKMTLKALLWPTPMIMRFVAIHEPLSLYYKNKSLLKLTVEDKEYFNEFKTYIAKSFLRSKNEFLNYKDKWKGYYYKMNSNYHVFHSCNQWSVSALELLGAEFSFKALFHPKSIFKDASSYGTVLIKPTLKEKKKSHYKDRVRNLFK